MERKKPSDFPQKPLDLFSEYRHGHIDRRSFLDGARTFAVSGVTVGAAFEMMRPNYVWAQGGKETHPASARLLDQRVAGSQIEMVRVREYDVRADLGEVADRERLDRALRADGHKRGGLDRSVIRLDETLPRPGGIDRTYGETEWHRRARYRMNIASP